MQVMGLVALQVSTGADEQAQESSAAATTGAISAMALPRCEIASFSSRVSSALVSSWPAAQKSTS